MRLTRILSVASLVAIGAVASALPAMAAIAVDESPGGNLGGYIGQAAASAVSFQPFLPALISTGDVPFEVTLSLSTANVKSGGNAFGRGAIIWPGSAAADLGPLIGVGAGEPAIGALIPKWPLQAQATQDDGEVTTGLPPGLSMHATGFPDRSAGDARIADVNVPSLVHIEHVASTSSSIVTDNDVTTTARVVLHGVSLLNGHITIDQLLSTSNTSSNGTHATSDGDTVISGLRIGGFKVSVTDDGFAVEGAPGANGKPTPGQSPEAAVQSILTGLHARITLFRSVGNASGGVADRSAIGFVLSIDNPIGGTGPIPPGHFDLILGSTSSTTQAAPPFLAGESGLSNVGGAIGGSGASGSLQPRSITLGAGPSVLGTSVANLNYLASGALGTTTSAGTLGGSAPVGGRYRFGGIPIALVIALLIVAAIVSGYIRRFLNAIITPKATGSGEEQ